MYKDNGKEAAKQQADRVSDKMERSLLAYLGDLLRELDRQIDRRLVVTFVSLSMALLMHRHRNEGGWMSQLGSYLEPMNAEAGKKRIQKLLYSRKWDSGLLDKYLWQLGEQRVAAGEQAGESMLAIWDESVVEKSEALKLQGLGSVRSSKAVRLKRIKPGYFNPPGGRPIIVPGYYWLQVLICGRKAAWSLPIPASGLIAESRPAPAEWKNGRCCKSWPIACVPGSFTSLIAASPVPPG